MLPYRSKAALRKEDFRVDPAGRPGWVPGTMRLPREGEAVFCAAGLGTVKSLGGRTGDGSRLLQILLGSAATAPFFAAASNVLLPPLATPPLDGGPGGDAAGVDALA